MSQCETSTKNRPLLTREDKKKVILGIIHEGFHMDVTTEKDEDIAELILKVCEA